MDQLLRWERADRCGGCDSRKVTRAWKVGPATMIACRECGLQRLYERVLQDDLPLLYAGGYACDAVPEAADLEQQLANPTFAYRLSRLERVLDGRPRRIFEIGCGDGNFLAFLQRAGWSVSGCDADTAAVDTVRRRHGIAVSHADVTRPSELASVPVMAAYHVLEHIYEPRAWLTAVHGNLADNGLLHLQVPNHASITRMLSGGAWASIVYPQHVQFFTPHTLQELLRRSGFHVLSMSTWDPWHGPGTVAITLKNALKGLVPIVVGRADGSGASAPSRAADTATRRDGASRARSLFRIVTTAAARAEAAAGRGAVVDVIARRV